MTNCAHQQLVLINPPTSKLRCRHCHLTLGSQDLHNGCCPECWDVRGQRQADFEEIEADPSDIVRYRCEQCGVIIESLSSKQ